MDVARTIENAAMTASPWEYHAALLPLCFEDFVVAGHCEVLKPNIDQTSRDGASSSAAVLHRSRAL
jgi:hypothetical protein